ncbi:Uncharacterised protein [Raoultella ornithinolytica]|nr:Uncharacterised protein [Raoultella ornithinolytica]
MTITCNLYTDGQWHDAEDQATFTRTNPLSEQPASTASAASLADARRSVEAAAAAFPQWRDTAPRRTSPPAAGGGGANAAT